MAKKKLTRAQLEQKVKELTASSASIHAIVHADIDKISTDYCMASAVLVEFTVLGGRKVGPVLIRDGLSKETVKAFKDDIIRSQKLDLMFVVK